MPGLAADPARSCRRCRRWNLHRRRRRYLASPPVKGGGQLNRVRRTKTRGSRSSWAKTPDRTVPDRKAAVVMPKAWVILIDVGTSSMAAALVVAVGSHCEDAFVSAMIPVRVVAGLYRRYRMKRKLKEERAQLDGTVLVLEPARCRRLGGGGGGGGLEHAVPAWRFMRRGTDGR